MCGMREGGTKTEPIQATRNITPSQSHKSAMGLRGKTKTLVVRDEMGRTERLRDDPVNSGTVANYRCAELVAFVGVLCRGGWVTNYTHAHYL